MDRLALLILRGAGWLALIGPFVGIATLFVWSISPLPPGTLPSSDAFAWRWWVATNLCWVAPCAVLLGLVGFAGCWTLMRIATPDEAGDAD